MICFQLNLSIFLFKDQKRTFLCRLFNWKWLNLIENVKFNNKYSCIWPFSIKFDIFCNQILCPNSYCIVATSKSGGLIWIKKLIKRQFEFDFKQILAWGRLDRISFIKHYVHFARVLGVLQVSDEKIMQKKNAKNERKLFSCSCIFKF